MKKIKQRTFGFLGVIFLGYFSSGCAPSNGYSEPKFGFLPKYNSYITGAPVIFNNDLWWKSLQDETLNGLIDQALRGNINLQVAKERINVARLYYLENVSSLSGSADASLRVQGSNDVSGSVSQQQGLSIEWLLDPYGTKNADMRVNSAQVEIAEAELSAARLLIVYNVSISYLDLRYSQERARVLDLELGELRKQASVVDELLRSGQLTKIDEARIASRIANTEAKLPTLRSDVAAKMNELAVLLGKTPGALQSELRERKLQPRPKLPPNIGIPAELLRNRPDIWVSERKYYIAVESLVKANAARYPRLSISGAISLDTKVSGNNNGSYFFGPSVELPIFNRKGIEAEVSKSQHLVSIAHSEWKASVLNAILEVENALEDYNMNTLSLVAAGRSVDASSKVLMLSKNAFDGRGDITQNDILNAELDLSTAKLLRAEVLYKLGISFVTLNVKLGGAERTVASKKLVK